MANRGKWEDIEDELEARTEVQKFVRPKEIKENGVEKTINETIQITKRIFPVRKVVMERKKIKKFGEVQGVETGQHKLGDFAIGEVISIITPESEEKQEIDLVRKIRDNMTSEAIKSRKNQNELDRLEGQGEVEEKKVIEEEKGAQKIKFAGVGDQEYSLKISNIFYLEYEDGKELKIEDQEKDFRKFIQETLKMDDRRDYHLKVLRQKNNRNKLADISYLSCTHREKFEKIEKALYDVDYNNCILQVSRAANAAPRKDKEPRRDNNRRY